ERVQQRTDAIRRRTSDSSPHLRARRRRRGCDRRVRVAAGHHRQQAQGSFELCHHIFLTRESIGKERREFPRRSFSSTGLEARYLPSRQPLKFGLLRSENGTVIVVLEPYVPSSGDVSVPDGKTASLSRL